MTTLAEIRAKLAASNTSKENTPSGIFPHWLAPMNTTTTVRLLPDANDQNGTFWIEKKSSRIKFKGMDQDIYVTIPCLENWGQSCFVKEMLRPCYKADKENIQHYNAAWTKTVYHMNALIIDTQLEDEDLAETPVRSLIFTNSLFNVVKTFLMDEDVEDVPTDYDKGYDFKIKKTQKGNYADYTSSSFSMKPRKLTQNERSAIDKCGLKDLSTFIGTKPDEEKIALYKEVVEAYINFEDFDHARWGSLLS